jgi:CHAT domain-containing protein
MRLVEEVEGGRTNIELAEQLGKARAQLTEIVKRVRDQDPTTRLTDLPLPDLLHLIPEGGALVAPVLTSHGSKAFVIPHGVQRIEAANLVELSGLTNQDILDMLTGRGRTIGTLGMLKWRTDPQRWKSVLEEHMRQLWDDLLFPIHNKLLELGVKYGAEVVVLTQACLGLFPLHAAWREVQGKRRYFLDDFVVSYAPSLRALETGRRRLMNSQGRAPSLLAIVNSTGDLAFAEAEGEAVAQVFQGYEQEVIVGADCKLGRVVSSALGCTYLHFACHGHFDPRFVDASGLQMAGEESLSLSDVFSRLDLRGCRLVTLSACETGIVAHEETPDEFIGLPAGFIHAGASGVLSTLWPVHDRATSLLMGRFYTRHIRDRLSPTVALRDAQLWLRNATRKEIGDYFKSFVRLTPATAQQAHIDIILGGDPKDRPFASPYYWAAFTLNGL